MRSFSIKTALVLAVLLSSAFIWASCGDGDSTTPDGSTPDASTPGASTPAASTPTDDDTASGVPTPANFQTSSEPIEQTFEQGVLPNPLVGVASASQTLWDRLVFEFDRGAPDYRVEYIDPPITQCASGEPVEVRGEAFIQVRFGHAQAHDLDGNPTIDSTTVARNGPSMVEAVQTCDFEGVVTWVVGVTQEVDFRVFTILKNPFTWQVVVDTKHP